MLLEGKNAIVYGGGGMIGGAVARAFAREGATVHLAGLTAAPLDAVAGEIRAAGGAAETATLDALDEAAVGAHADAVAARWGSLDVSMSLISQGDVQGTPLAEMSFGDFERPVRTTLRAAFLTSQAAARHMIRQRSGVVLMFGGYGDPQPRLGGLQVAFGALEALRRALACELGPSGIRVLTLQTGGIAGDPAGGVRGAAGHRRQHRGPHHARPGGHARRRRPRRRVRRLRSRPEHDRDRPQHHLRLRGGLTGGGLSRSGRVVVG